MTNTYAFEVALPASITCTLRGNKHTVAAGRGVFDLARGSAWTMLNARLVERLSDDEQRAAAQDIDEALRRMEDERWL